MESLVSPIPLQRGAWVSAVISFVREMYRAKRLKPSMPPLMTGSPIRAPYVACSDPTMLNLQVPRRRPATWTTAPTCIQSADVCDPPRNDSNSIDSKKSAPGYGCIDGEPIAAPVPRGVFVYAARY